MDIRRAQRHIDEVWDDSIVPELVDYIKIPNKSPHFDPAWEEHGYMEDAVTLVADWCRRQPVRGLEVEVVRLPGRTPLIFMEVPGSSDRTVMLYGHLDKQPEMTGWDDDLGPWKPVMKGDLLYGRGGADDGYAAFASLTAIAALQAQGLPHARLVIIIEACEESGSFDLPPYLELLDDRIGSPELVICLDSGAGNYDQLWLTTSLRGLLAGSLRVNILEEGVHSGYGSGAVPSSFRIARALLSRLEDEATGRIALEALHVGIPDQKLAHAEASAALLGAEIYRPYPFVSGAGPMADSALECLLNRTWRPALSVTGADGLPAIQDAGNVLRPGTALKLSLRLPPTMDGEKAADIVKELLERDAPYGAHVEFVTDQVATGWNAPDVAPWLADTLQRASQAVFGADVMYIGEGGTIPFMAMLGETYPEAQFVITGVLGPKSNAHGPNEFLHVPFARQLTACVAQVLSDHADLGVRDAA